MKAFSAKPATGLEDRIQNQVISALRLREWYVKILHGTAFQSGLPDLFATHVAYGQRWIEIKVPDGGKFTRAQYDVFPKLVSHGSPVWILTSPDQYDCLFGDCNWWHYLDKLPVQTGAYVANSPLRQGEETRIQLGIIAALEAQGWFCKITYGDEFQNGLPDVYATHPKYGPRWIEVKRPVGWKFTPAQSKVFPLLIANGSGVWVLTSVDQIGLLSQPCNYWQFLIK